jgi:sensor c-di-GMP phosphodiesterase-like protein
VTKRHRTEALLAAAGVFVLAIMLSLGWASWTEWHSARDELTTVARAVDRRSVQVRAETMELAAALPESDDCDRALLRKLLGNMHYVRDVGRIHNNRIYCNSMDGAGASIELGPPTVMRGSDGLRMWIGARGIYAALGHSFLRMDPMSLIDMPLPPDTVVAVMDAETGHLLTHSAPLPKTLLQAAAKLRQGELRQDGYLVVVSSSKDSRTVDIAARPQSALQAAFVASLPKRLSFGAALGALSFALVMAAFLRRHSLLSELRRALQMRKINIALQPIVTAFGPSPRIVAFECLARWTREDGQSMSPAVFVPMVESAGWSAELVRSVLSSLLSSFSDALNSNPEIHVTLNFSSADVANARLLDDLERMLAAARVPASQIVIELTESGSADVPGLADGLMRLRRKGHWIGVDDFGTGTSNASRLAAFRPEIVKVDRSFLLHAHTLTHAAELLPQLVAMARGCGAKVVVEGVETPDHAALLAGFGSDVFGQGYYWHRPMTPEAAARLLRIAAKTAESTEQPDPDAVAPAELAPGPGPYSASA